MDHQTAQIIERVGEGILQHAQAEEQQLDAQLAALENMGEDDFELLRQKRRLEMQKQARKEQDWRQLGHGRYLECNDTKDFFNMCKKSERVVAHMYRPVTARCQIVDAHFEKLAQTHLETRFIKVDVEKNPFLAERLHIILMPSIVLIKGGKTDHTITGFDEFGGTDDFTTEDVAWVLSQHQLLNYTDADRSEEIQKRSAKSGYNTINMERIRAGEYDHELEDDI